MSHASRRYGGEALGDRPHIAVLGSSRLGNYVVTTPLLRGLKERWPAATVDFFGSPATAELERACPWIDWRTSVFPLGDGRLAVLPSAAIDRLATTGPYDLAINCNGFNPHATSLTTLLEPEYFAGAAPGDDVRHPPGPDDHPYHRMVAETDWTTAEFRERYAGWLTSNYIGELFCRMAFIETDFFRIELESRPPRVPVPDVLVHASSSRDAKLWPADRWLAVLDWCAARDLDVGLVGVAPARTAPGALESDATRVQDPVAIESALASHPAVTDLRGRTSPLELAGAFREAGACVSVDSGPLHVAAAVRCPTVAICATDAAGVGASPRDLWMPRGPHVRVTVSERTCGTCLANRFRNAGCLEPEPVCQFGVSPDQVIALLADALETGTNPRLDGTER